MMNGSATSPIYNVAVIGAGEVAMTVHLPTLLLHSHMYRVVALVDVSKEALAHCAAKFHIPFTYTSVDDMLREREEVDAVMIINANEYHVTQAVQCMQAGKHVFIEKPMAWTLEGADQIIAAEKASGKSVFVGYMRRYAGGFVRAKERLQMIPTSNITYVRVRDIIGQNSFFVQQGGWFVKSFTDFPPESFAERKAMAEEQFASAIGPKAKDPRNQFTWGLLNGLASHDLSAMRELIGMPQKVLCATRSDDGLFMTVTFQYEGFVAYYEMGIDNVRVFDAHIEVYAGSERIKVQYDTPYVKGLPVTMTVLSSTEEGDHVEQVVRPTYEDPYTLEYKAWYETLQTNKVPKTSASDAKLDLEIFTMIMSAL